MFASLSWKLSFVLVVFIILSYHKAVADGAILKLWRKLMSPVKNILWKDNQLWTVQRR